MKKIVFPLVAMAIIMSACVKPNETDEPITTRFSVLGDSFSAFEGYVDPNTNAVYHYEEIGVTGPEQMWWHILSTKKEWQLERNNSYSGALICNFNYVNYYGPYSFIRRMDGLGDPNVIFIFGATNDACDGVLLGDYVYEGWNEEQLCTFRPALSYLFENLKQLYPNAQLYFLVDMNLGSGGIDVERRDAFIESIHRISNHYGVNCIDLYDIHKNKWHPDTKGQKDIANQILEYLETEAV